MLALSCLPQHEGDRGWGICTIVLAFAVLAARVEEVLLIGQQTTVENLLQSATRI